MQYYNVRNFLRFEECLPTRCELLQDEEPFSHPGLQPENTVKYLVGLCLSPICPHITFCRNLLSAKCSRTI